MKILLLWQTWAFALILSSFMASAATVEHTFLVRFNVCLVLNFYLFILY